MQQSPPDHGQLIERQLSPTKRAIEARQGGWTDLLQGIPIFARFLRGVRTGTNNHFDTNVGTVISSGANAGFVGFDQVGGNNNYVAVSRYGTHVYIGTEANGALVDLDAATGIVASAWTVVTAFTGTWADATASSGMATVRYKRDLLGNVRLVGSVKSGALGTSAFTLPAGYRPTTYLYAMGIDATNSLVRMDISTAGTFTPQTGAPATFMAFDCYFATV